MLVDLYLEARVGMPWPRLEWGVQYMVLECKDSRHWEWKALVQALLPTLKEFTEFKARQGVKVFKDKGAYLRKAWHTANRALKWDTYQVDLALEMDSIYTCSTETGHKGVAHMTRKDMCRTVQCRTGKGVEGATHTPKVMELLADNRY